MKTVLIIGHDSTIGSALGSHLNQLGYKVLSTTRRRQLADNTSIFYLDLLKAKKFKFNAIVDTVYLCAGNTNIASCEQNPNQSHQINVTAQNQLATYFLNQGAHVVFLSSNGVFDGKSYNYTEQSKPNAITTYGKQKAAAEQMLLSQSDKISILRPTKVLSPTNQLICHWIRRLSASHPIEAFLNVTFAPVPVNQVSTCLTILGEQKLPGIYHLSGAKDLSYFEFSLQLARLMGVDKNLIKPITLEKDKSIQYIPKYNRLDMSYSNAFFNMKREPISNLIKTLYSELI